MPKPTSFPHLPLIFYGVHKPRFRKAIPQETPESLWVAANNNNKTGHAANLTQRLQKLRGDLRTERKARVQAGKPLVGDSVVIGLRLPPNQFDLTFLENQFGLELVSEGDDGLLLVGSQDLDFAKLEEAIRLFSTGSRGGGSTANILEIYGPSDGTRLDAVLDEELRSKWPFPNDEILTLDVIVEVPHHQGYVRRGTKRGPKGEDAATKAERFADMTKEATQKAAEKWDQQRDRRVEAVTKFIRLNGGEILQELEEQPEEQNGVVSFPDSVLVRVRMSGLGFRDLVLNVPWLVKLGVTWTNEGIEGSGVLDEILENQEIITPSPDAPRVCVIDSGIQENHRLLAPVVVSAESQCFVSGRGSDETQDEVRPAGHGTKVAGAVIYPQQPVAGEVIDPVAWLQNARVLDADSQFSPNQNPLKNIEDVIRIYRNGPTQTRLFVHSINAREACRLKRMTAWAAKLDTHSHQDDVLFFQSAGNIEKNSVLPTRLGVRQHIAAGRDYPDYLSEDSCRIASPAQSLHAITVGSVTLGEWEEGFRRSFADSAQKPSAFSRSGLGIWGSIKPDLVEYGGDLQRTDAGDVRACLETAPWLVQSTAYGSPATGRDVGTSFAAPKVAHIAAVLQNQFPEASSQLYRALIINSARWPQWAEQLPPEGRLSALSAIGYGIPDLSRATENTATRVTLITADAREIRNQQALVYAVPVPTELRDSATPCQVRIDVTLCYTAEPRQTRATRHGYLETWLGWTASDLEEPYASFESRATKSGDEPGKYTKMKWMLRENKIWGEIEGVSRQNGTAQKDWTIVSNTNLPDEFAIAVQAHKGWNRDDHGGLARFALVVSFEVIGAEIPVHTLVESEIQARIQSQVTV